MLVQFAGIMVVVSPAALLAVLGLATLFRIPLSERSVARFAQTSSIVGLIASLCILAWMLTMNIRNLPLELGDWVSLENAVTEVDHGTAQLHAPATDEFGDTEAAEVPHAEHFHFLLKFVFDRLSVPFAIMSFVLCGVIGAFAFRYLHLEEGYYRFFLYYSILQ